METNVGEILELAVRRQNVNISELSRNLKVNRRTLYNWFRQKKLPHDVIYKIGKAINYDFSNDFDGEFGKSNELSNSIDKNYSRHEPPDTIYYWMEKYIDLLEDYKKLLNKGPLIF